MKIFAALVALAATGSTSAFAPAPVASRAAVSTNMAASEDFYIDDERRFVMNLVMVGAGGLAVAAIGIPYIAFFFPPGAGGDGGGVPAKDALGDDILAKTYLTTKPAGDRSLAQGLKGDAT
jgi:cytochrome b6-f complex iron-sulfur subunit